jgi:hypothetical protein
MLGPGAAAIGGGEDVSDDASLVVPTAEFVSAGSLLVSEVDAPQAVIASVTPRIDISRVVMLHSSGSCVLTVRGD